MPAKTTVSPADQAAQRGYGTHKWVDDKTASGSLQVLTDATLYYDLSDGEVVMIESMSYNLESVSDNCTFELVSCTAAAGAGTATQLCAKAHSFTPAARNQVDTSQFFFDPPIRVAYADGALSISARVNSNDAAAVIHVGWMGYRDVSLV